MRFRSGLAAIAALATLASCQHAPQTPAIAADLLITGGMVHDGTGAAPELSDIAIDDGRIVAVLPAGAPVIADRKIDAAGLVVAPGFIDPHTHAGYDLQSGDERTRANLPWLFQGVTTVVVGNDGDGDPNVARLAAEAREAGIGSNVAYLVGFGHVRSSVLGEENRAPDAAEMAAMEGLVTSAMCKGAFGFSAGLYYTPQNFAAFDEVAALTARAGEQGGYYDTHLRDESDYSIGLLAAVDEALAIGEASGAPVHISHVKALGPAVWGQSADVIARVEAARAAGQRVTADQYPWRASGTRVSNALVPRWALDGGLEGLRRRFDDPDLRAEIAAQMQGNLARRGGADALLFTGALGGSEVSSGQTLQTFADTLGLDPVEAAITLLGQGDMRVASFNMNPEDIAAFAVQDWVVTGSDGSTGHPRKYASFPKAYRDLVVEGQMMSLARFIQRSTSQTADLIGITDRGTIAPGMVADIVVLDPATYVPRASYEQPEELSAGVRYLLVNGALAIADGEYTGALSGQPLLRAGAGSHPACR